MSSSATYTGPWLHFRGDIHQLGCMKRGLSREIYKRAKEKSQQGQLTRLISYTVKGESISTFWNLTFQYYWYAKSGSNFVPGKKKKILSQSFSWTIGTLKVHETRVSISVLWKQKMELSLVCKELSVNDGSECTHTLPRPSLLGPKTWQLQCDFLRESKLPLAERVTLTAAFPNVRTSRNYSGM